MTGIDSEMPILFEELFFSRTDERGKIVSGNAVFQRVSLYSWEEMLGKPHNIIRHDDMPRAVFWLLWDRIRQGHPIGAYVKNRAKDGRYYWVYAVVTPIQGGFLSVRLKPSTALFGTVQAVYSEIQALEQNGPLKPAESAALLVDRLRQEGFSGYSEFMTAALSQELKARDVILGRSSNKAMGRFDQLKLAAGELLNWSSTIFDAYEAHQYVPLNLRVQAAQLGELGTAIDVISNNYSVLSHDIRINLEAFVASARSVVSAIGDGMFLTGTATLQREVVDFFRSEAADASIDGTMESAILQAQCDRYEEKAVKGLRDIRKEVERFVDVSLELKRLAAGLEVTRIMGKVESARLSATSLKGLIDDLGTLQGVISEGLRAISYSNETILNNT